MAAWPDGQDLTAPGGGFVVLAVLDIGAKVAAEERPHSAQGFTIRVWAQAHLLSNGEATLR